MEELTLMDLFGLLEEKGFNEYDLLQKLDHSCLMRNAGNPEYYSV